MASVMKRIVENRGDGQIVFAAILEVAGNVRREGRIFFAQDVTNVVQPQNDGSQVLGQASRHASSTAYEEFIHLSLAGQIFDRMGQKIRQAYRLRRNRGRHGQQVPMGWDVLKVINRGDASGAAFQTGMCGDIFDPFTV
jgi:hypothetical protein